MTQVDMALETMHTCSTQSKTAQKNTTKQLEEQKLEVRINSKSTQLKTGRNSCTGYTGAHAPVHPMATGYTGAMPPVHPDSSAGSGEEKHSVTGYTGAPWTSTGLYT